MPTNMIRMTLQVNALSKSFGSLEALKPLSVDFQSGEIHAVVGENGAGKSTLMNLIGGFLSPSTGSILLNNQPIPNGSPRNCRRLGISMVHQHFMLVPEFTLKQNIDLSLLGLGEGSFSDIQVESGKFGWQIPWEKKVSDVSVGIQQRVEILKSLAGSPKVVIFDEPTAVLSEEEVTELFALLRRLAEAGKIVILIAHKVREVLSIADRITVLRRGIHIKTVPSNEVDSEQLIEWMVGERLSVSPPIQANSLSQGLEVNGTASFQVKRGEILGIGGVDGNGQLELSESLAGVTPFQGTLEWKGSPLNFNETSVGFVPQDRRADGLVLSMSIEENIRIARLNESLPQNHTENLINQFSIKAESALDKASQLSGGNQQKVILARVLDAKPELLVVVNPTRGLDVKASQFVHNQLLNAAQSGTAIVLFTADPDELATVSHRQLYMSRSKLYATEQEALNA